MRAFFIGAILFASLPAHPAEISLGLPIACDFGKTCWVQQYPDHDPGPGAKDYTCGVESYDGHDGTDIRVLDTTHTADVIASAGGIVKALRDGVPDHLVRTPQDRAAVASIECGNGVVIAHEAGWETQYCHMKRGSVVVRKGQTVARGGKLGEVGYSGDAAFPHVHITVRQNGKAVDPFLPSTEQSCGAGGPKLWTAAAAAALAYQPASILRVGFAPGPVGLASVESGMDAGAPQANWPALVAYAWAINLEKDDQIAMAVDGPNGIHAENRDVLTRSKAQYLLFAGVPKPRPGDYVASFKIIRDGKTYLEQSWTAKLK